MKKKRKTIFFIGLILACLFIILQVYKIFISCTEFQNCNLEACSGQRAVSASVYKHNAPFIPLNYSILKALTKSEITDIYWRYISSNQVLCCNQTRLGSAGDGGKEVCVDDLYKPRQPCLVYSFGSNFQFDFELDVVQLYGCEVHTFDPSKQIGHRIIPRGVNFHLVGLSNSNTTNEKGWKMKTMLSIRKELNHTNRVLDLLKIDIEGGEWEALPEMFQSGVLKDVKQICMEIHLTRDIAMHLDVLRQLYEQGFYIFMHEHNLFTVRHLMDLKRIITSASEISLVKVN